MTSRTNVRLAARARTALLLASLVSLPLSPPGIARAASPPKTGDDPLLAALQVELQRSMKSLKGHGEAPLYYLAYRVSDGQWFSQSASFGALAEQTESGPLAGRARQLFVSARVGSPALDNTHKVRGGYSDAYWRRARLPIEDDPLALRISLWRETDRAYNAAVKQLIRIKANKQVKVEEEDRSDDFSKEPPHAELGPRATAVLDLEAWKERLRRASSLFKSHPQILQSSLGLQGGAYTFYFVDSDGTRVREPRFYAQLTIAATVRADDGMELQLSDDFDVRDPSQLPSEIDLEQKTRRLIERLEALRAAPVVEPYSGPAIVMNRAAAVFFHEIFGHRIEGHRQKDADEGRTFTKKLNQRVMPPFVSVVDDPTLKDFGGRPLNGTYRFDDEGVPAQRVNLVEDGILKGFLMGRSPIAGFARSNGHGRAEPSASTVARQGNLIVQSSRRQTPAELRASLVEELKRRNKPFGLVFDDIAGGFTSTRAGWSPQAFKVLPLVVYRVFADGRPDELVRGVDIVGTPLQSLGSILATGDDPDIFNGYCGAESGQVPVAAVAPSLLIGEIEVERRAQGHDRPPLLPAPPVTPVAEQTP